MSDTAILASIVNHVRGSVGGLSDDALALVPDAVADSRDVADAHRGDAPVRLYQQRRVLLHGLGALDGALRGEGADVQGAAGVLDGVVALHAVQADQVLRLDQRLLQQRREGGAAGDQLRVAVVLCQQRGGLFEGVGCVEVEVVHGYPFVPAAALPIVSAAAFIESMIW